MSFEKRGTNFLKGIRNFRYANGLTTKVISEYLRALDTPRALTVWILYESGEHQQLANLICDPLNYQEVEEFRRAYRATKFLSKAKFLQTGLDLKEVALAKFHEFEILCRHTNCRFRNLGADPNYHGSVVWLHSAVIRKISRILGDFSIEEFLEMPDWGPGASTLIKRRDASPANKFQQEVGITRDLYGFVSDLNLMGSYPLWFKRLSEAGFPSYQVGNRIVTVPKDASTDRVIAIEPGINLWFQMSLGKMIGRRLQRFGIDLRWQNRNQQLARSSSKTGELATVDMSSASDSISIEVVRELIPPDWFFVMDKCRSQFGTQSGAPTKMEKFSSMGNGFTFQLETLIFFAIASCICERRQVSSRDVSVYGDDILLPTTCFEELCEVMSFYGFRVNTKKSHFRSVFRESCGVHYFDGVDCKPIYLRDKLSTVQTGFRLANSIRRMSRLLPSNEGFGCDLGLRKVWSLIVQKTPSALRLWIPEQLGDGGFIVNFDEATPTRCRNGIEGYYVRHLAELSLTKYVDNCGLLLAHIWRLEKSRTSTPDQPDLFGWPGSWDRPTLTTIDDFRSAMTTSEGNSTSLVGRTKSVLIKSVVQRWIDLGPWL